MSKTTFPGVSQRGSVYVATPYNPATKQKVHLGTCSTPEAAYELVREWKLGGARDRTIAGIRESWLDLHVDSDNVGLVPATRRGYRNYSARLVDRFGTENPDDLYDHYEKVQGWAKDESAACVETCFSMFEWARKKRLCKSNPFEGVDGRAQVRRESKVLIRSEAELDRLANCALTVLPGHKGEVMAALIYTAFGTMLRPAHLFKLTEADLDFKRSRIKAPAVKRGGPQEVAMLPIARKGFNMLRRGAPDDHVFVNTWGNPLRKSTMANWWPAVRAAFGEPTMVFYDLKTSGASWLVAAGAEPDLLKVQLTHQDKGDTLRRHYLELEVERALQHVERVASVAAERESSGFSGADQSLILVGGAA